METAMSQPEPQPPRQRRLLLAALTAAVATTARLLTEKILTYLTTL
jgi:hypothetical protein